MQLTCVRAAAAACLAACGPHSAAVGEKIETRSDECSSCHLDEWRTTTSPVHTRVSFGTDCGGCHVQTQWSPAQGFAHTQSFPLTQAHAEPSCAACHGSKGFERGAVENSCASCHAPQAAAVSDPVHAGLSTSCSACHRTDAFAPATFVHAWPLVGAHAIQGCASCHTGSPARYEGTSSACITCHADERARADRSIAGHAGYAIRCESCHGFASFQTGPKQ